MLRRDVEYVLVWDGSGHRWLARPVKRDGDRLILIGRSATTVELPAWDGRFADGADE